LAVYGKKALANVTLLFFTCICNSTSAQFTGSLSGGFASRDSRITEIAIEEVLTDSLAQFKIWPNPCSDYFTISSDSYLELSGIATDGKMFLNNIYLIPKQTITFSSAVLNKGTNILNFKNIKKNTNYCFTLIKY
jgi:hypothetical protein